MTATEMQNRVNELMARDNTHSSDRERQALFIIISGNDELWNLRESIYDFNDNSINSKILDSGICESSKTLIRIGYNLYNSYPTDSLLDCFSGLDTNNFELVMYAIKFRLSM